MNPHDSNPITEDDLLDLIEGDLAPERERAVRSALEGDPDLRRYLEAMIADRAVLTSFAHPSAQPHAPASVMQGVHEALERHLLLGTAEQAFELHVDPLAERVGEAAGEHDLRGYQEPAHLAPVPNGYREAKPGVVAALVRSPWARGLALAAAVLLTAAVGLQISQIVTPPVTPSAAPTQIAMSTPEAEAEATPESASELMTGSMDSSTAPASAGRQTRADATVDDLDITAPAVQRGQEFAKQTSQQAEPLTSGLAEALNAAEASQQPSRADLLAQRRLALRVVSDASARAAASELAFQQPRRTPRPWRLRADAPESIVAVLRPAGSSTSPQSPTLNTPGRTIMADQSHGRGPDSGSGHGSIPQRPAMDEPTRRSIQNLPPGPSFGVYLLELPDDPDRLDATVRSLSRQLGARIETVELDEPLTIEPELDARQLFWWTQPPRSWQPRAVVPLILD